MPPLAVWSYVPQRQAVVTLTAAVDVVTPSPRAEVVGAFTDTVLREFQFDYPLVGSSEVQSMAAFFTARQGPWEAFILRSPTDSRTYLVRFPDALELEHFEPALFRTRPLVFTEVRS